MDDAVTQGSPFFLRVTDLVGIGAIGEASRAIAVRIEDAPWDPAIEEALDVLVGALIAAPERIEELHHEPGLWAGVLDAAVRVERLEVALALAGQLFAELPTHPAAQHLASRVATEAKEIGPRADEWSPTMAGAYIDLAWRYLEQDDLAPARAVLEQGLAHCDLSVIGRGATRLDEERLVGLHAQVRLDQALAPAGDGVDRDALDDALRDLDLLVERLPDDPGMRHDRAIAKLLADDTEGSLDDLRRVLEVDPDDIDALEQVGGILEFDRAFDEAMAYYDRVVELDPERVEGWRNRGDVLAELGRLPEARDSYERELAMDPAHIGSLVGLASLATSEGDLDEGLELAAAAWNRDPGSPDTVAVLAEVRIARGDALAAKEEEGAAEEYEEASAMLDELARLQGDDVVLCVTKAHVALQLGHTDEAVDAARLAVELAPQDVHARLALGAALEEAGDNAAALESYYEIIRLHPDDPAGYIARGDLRRNTGKARFAAWDFERALAREPDSTWAMLGRAGALSDLVDADLASGLVDDALAKAEEILILVDRAGTLGAPPLDVQWLRGLALRDLESYDEAVVAFDKATEAAGARALAAVLLDRGETLRVWGNELWEPQRSSEAAGSLRRAATLGDHTVEVIATTGLGWALVDLADHEAAIEAFRRTLLLDDTQDLARVGLGHALLLGGRPIEAADVLRDLLDRREEPAYLLDVETTLAAALLATGADDADVMDLLRVEADDAQVATLLDRSDIWVALGHFDEAERDLRDAVSIAPASAEAVNLLAWFLCVRRDDPDAPEEAVALAFRAVELEGDGLARVNYLDTYGWALHKSGRHEAAAGVFDEVLSIDRRQLGFRRRSEAARSAAAAGANDDGQ